jgi:uncharacterized protein with von Willebrand factor type A (vWA) domain
MNVIKQDALDKVIFDELHEVSDEIQRLAGEERGTNDYDLVSDVYASLYKGNPQVAEESSVQKSLLEQMISTQEYRDVRESTQFDSIASGIATVAMGDEVMKAYRQQKQKQQESGEGEDYKPSEEDLGNFRRRIRVAANEAQAQADDFKDGVSMLGCGEGGNDYEKLPMERKWEIAQTLKDTAKFKRIADLFGRFRNLAHGAVAQNPTHGYDEIVDITTGNDLSRVLPSELSKLLDPDLETLFLKDFAEKNLLCYELQGVENMGKGPLVVCLDISGSMSGDPEEWAKAVVLALGVLASKQGRAFGISLFDWRVVSSKFYNKNNPWDLDERLEFLSIQSRGGGTDFNEALRGGFDLRNEEKELKPADIVLITDGISSVNVEQFLAEKQETGVRIHGIGIGEELDVLRELLDSEIVIHDTKEINIISGLLDSVAHK